MVRDISNWKTFLNFELMFYNFKKGEDDVRTFFHTLDTNRDGYIDLIEFKQAFEKSL